MQSHQLTSSISACYFRQVLEKLHLITSFFLVGAFIFWSNQIFGQCDPDPNSISGMVFLDANFSGSYDGGDDLATNTIVSAYDQMGNKISETVSSDVTGFALVDLIDGEVYRLEFTPLSADQNAMASATGTNIQFVKAPACGISFGVQRALEMCSTNPDVAVSCFVRGPFDSYQDYPTVVNIEHDFTSASDVAGITTKEETGSVWGLVWRQKSHELVTSSFVKQYVPLTSHGHGAIFVTRYSSTGEVQTSLFVDLEAEGIDVGTLPVTNAQNCNYGPQAGKYGLGGLTLSADQSDLYVVNIYNNTLVRIPIADPSQGAIESVDIPDPGCSNSEYRAFALEEHEGKLYIGITCTAETSKQAADSKAIIYEYNPDTKNFAEIFSTNYIKGYWKNNQVQNQDIAHWFTDLAFTDEGNIVIGLTDRIGHMFCNLGAGRLDQQFPDILVLWNDNGTWKLENNGSAGPLSGQGIGNGQGPGGGEFFAGDNWVMNPVLHNETALGSVFTLRGTGTVITTAYDPLEEAYSGGLIRFNTSNGTKLNAIELYTRNFDQLLGKATGFGDMDALCGGVPIEIGNYVWLDDNDNGIQDPDEAPVEELQVSLFDDDCNLVGRVLTDAKGEYYFNSSNVDVNGDGEMDGLEYERKYFIVVDDPRFDEETELFEFEGIPYTLTKTDSGASHAPDQTDSDATLLDHSCNEIDGYPAIMVVTGGSGDNNYDFDIGFSDSYIFDLALQKINVVNSMVKISDLVKFEIRVFNQGNVTASNVEIVDYLSSAFDFISEENPDWSHESNLATTVIPGPIMPGESAAVAIYLKVNLEGQMGTMGNIAEIAAAEDPLGNLAQDIDSTPDKISSNDKGVFPGLELLDISKDPISGNHTTTDDWIHDNGAIDEDDHDFAIVRVLDLALKKTINGDTEEFLSGEDIPYQLTVYNQGNEDAHQIVLVDYFPESLIFNPAKNPGWEQDSDTTIYYQAFDILEASASMTVDLVLTIDPGFEGGDIINYGEIMHAESVNEASVCDFDSTPNHFKTDDIGGLPGSENDDNIDDHGIVDEDDHDPAMAVVRQLDVALYKDMVDSAAVAGETVEFNIHVINQGTQPVDNIRVTDYYDEFMELDDPGWTDLNNGKAYKILSSANGLLPILGLLNGDTVTVSIRLKVPDDAMPGDLVNRAEITSVTNELGYDISDQDIDSDLDDIRDNDAGGEARGETDDATEGDGTGPVQMGMAEFDEDDEDPGVVRVFDVYIDMECTCENDAEVDMPGNFSETLTIEGEAGLMWQVYENDGLYQSSGMMLYNPGDMMMDAAGVYTLEGWHKDGQGYVVTFINSEGGVITISNPGCDYNGIIVAGPGGVCETSQETYVIDNPIDGATYQWSIDPMGDHTFEGAVDQGTNVTINWGSSSNVTLHVEDISDPGECITPTELNVNIGIDNALTMPCRSEVWLALGSDCEVVVTPAMIVSGQLNPNAAYSVMLIDEHGNIVEGNLLGVEHIGKHITAKLIDDCSGNSCWGYVIVEDKLPPTIECEDFDISCFELEGYLPTAYDNCGGPVEIILVDQEIMTDVCDEEFTKTIVRYYKAVDKYGNESEVCEQILEVRRIDLDEIIYPENYEEADGRALTCNNYPVDENGYPDPSATGVPTYEGYPLFPLEDFTCKIYVNYEDEVILDTGCKKKILRRWIVFEACGDTNPYVEMVQVIEIIDPIAPYIECPHDIVVTTSGYTCEADVGLSMPHAKDNCSDVVRIELLWDDGFIQDFSGQPITLPEGSNVVTFRAFDDCHNFSECQMTVYVEDKTPPVAICDQHTIVGLTGQSDHVKVPASVLDDGSYDDCALKKFLGRRMDPSCGCEESYPHFEDMHYLGEYDGHHYYLSKDHIRGDKAFSLANAMGGYVAVIGNADEDSWLHGTIVQYFEEAFGEGEYYPYWIGLTDRYHEGFFEWQNGDPVGYTNWGPDQPDNMESMNGTDQDYVIVNGLETGTWVDTWAFTENKYVLEIEDPCGWSEYLTFCCEDSGEDQMVAFRAVDKWGNYNDCMVEVEVQDKVPPELHCPPDVTVECGYYFDYEDLSEFGTAEATDQCQLDLEVEILDNIDQCGVGYVKRIWTASDANGSVECSQYIYIENTDPFDLSDILHFPLDYETDADCSTLELSPEVLSYPYDKPIIDEDACDLLGITYKDKVFTFAGSGEACLKILRTWTIIDWCQYEDGFEPYSFPQVFKINNSVDPTIEIGDHETVVCTFDNNCIEGYIELTATGEDDCTPEEMLYNEYRIDLYSDGYVDIQMEGKGSMIDASDHYPIGTHIITYTFEDLCGNKVSEDQEFSIINCKAPIAACIDGLVISIQPWDTDYDGIPDIEKACLWASDFDAKSSHPCGYELWFSFSPDPEDKELCVDCLDVGVQEIHIFVTAEENGTQAYCVTTLNVQDNNDVDLCPDEKDCINWPEEELIVTDCMSDYDPETLGSVTTVDEDCVCEDYDISYDDVFDTDGDGCTIIERTWTVEFFCREIEPCTFLQTIRILNDLPPVLECPGDITAQSDGTVCGGFVSIPLPIVTSECNEDIVITHDSPFADDMGEDASGVYPVGMTTITFTATDKCGNMGTCSMTVTVEDVDPPSCEVQNITVTITEGGVVMIMAEDLNDGSMDLCDGTDLMYEVEPDSFNCGDLGENMVTVTVTDQSGNSSTCNATITVEEDNAPMCISTDITVTLDEDGMVSIMAEEVDGGSVDDCSGEMLDYSVDQMDFTCEDIGEVIVTLTVTDDDGNSDTCSATITIEEEEAPICVSQDITIALEDGGFVVIDPNDVDGGSTDNCDPMLDLMVTPDTLYCENLGVNEVVLKVTDDSGNMATCTAMVTVIDTIAPICVAADITLFLDEDGMVTLDPEDADGGSFDECGGDLMFEVDPETYFCNDVGMRTYTLTVTDESGNSSTCEGNITIVDEFPPEITCPGDLTIGCEDPIDDLSIYGEPMVDEACSTTEIVEEVFMNLNICNIGIIQRTFTVTDVSGNSAQCTQIILVEGPDDPIMESDITWPDSPVEVSNCEETDPEDLENGFPIVSIDSSDCAILSMDYQDADGNPEAECPDIILRTWTIRDSCQLTGDGVTGVFMFVQTINVIDTTPPDLMVPDDIIVELIPPACDTNLVIIAAAEDCSGNITYTNDSPYAEDNISEDASGSYPAGMTTVTFTATDECGNMAVDSVIVTVVDTVAPTYMCEKIFVYITDELNVVTNVNEIVTIVQSECGGEGLIQASYSEDDINDTLKTFDCNQVNTDVETPIWIFEDGEQIDFCNVLTSVRHLDENEPLCQLTPRIELTKTASFDAMAGVITYTYTVNNPSAFGMFDIEVNENMGTFTGTGALPVPTYQSGGSDEDGEMDLLDLKKGESMVFTAIYTVTEADIMAGQVTNQATASCMASQGDNINDVSDDGDDGDGNILNDPTVTPVFENGVLVDIDGFIKTETGEGVQNVAVDLLGASLPSVQTGAEGEYAFRTMPMGGAYSILPEKIDDYTNGVSTLDLILMQKHILGVEELDSPYKIIAADVNGSNSISVLDLVELRKLILGVVDGFSNNTSWRVVDANFTFSDSSNPFVDDFPEVYDIAVLNNFMHVDFVGIKVGDVNNSVAPNQFSDIEVRSNKELEFRYMPEVVGEQEAVFGFYANNFDRIAGFQFTLEYDADKMEFVGIRPGKLDIGHQNIGLRYLSEGLISLSYHRDGDVSIGDDEQLFEMRFELNKDDLSRLHLSSSVTRAEAYNLEDILTPILISEMDSDPFGEVKLHQNNPNPWDSETDLGFYLPVESDIEIRFYDISGRLLKSVKGFYEQGEHKIALLREEFHGSGLIYYQLTTGDVRLYKKMLLLK